MTPTDYRAAVAAVLAHAGQTAYGMAKLTGLTQQAILDVASGERPNPRADTLDKLLQAAGLDWAYLDRFRTPPAPPPEPVSKRK